MKKQISKQITEVKKHKFQKSSLRTDKLRKIKGYDFNNLNSVSEVVSSFKSTGLQSSNLSKAIDIINKMIEAKFHGGGCTIFLGFTSNMISCGVREVIRFLVEHKYVDCLCTTTGGIEEDIMKCLNDTYLGDFALVGKTLRPSGINRIGNLLVPNNNYIAFEDFMWDILDEYYERTVVEQEKLILTPTKLIRKFGEDIIEASPYNYQESVWYQCYKNDIPVHCPQITDGSVGDMLYMHGFKKPGLSVDILGDLRSLNEQALRAKRTGMILIGGGTVKHHISNANFIRGGADYGVFVNTGLEFDGSNAGGGVERELARGRVKREGMAVKVAAEGSLVMPIIVAETFAKFHHRQREEKKGGFFFSPFFPF